MPQQRIPPDCLLSVNEVAEIIGLDAKTIRNGECGTDELLRVKLGTRTVFSFNDVQEWIARRVRQAREERERRAQKTAVIERKKFIKDSVLRLLK